MATVLASRQRVWVFTAAAVVGVVLLTAGTYLVCRALAGHSAGEVPTQVVARKVINGHYVRLDPRAELVYAGIRAPYSGEPLFEHAKKRNGELVEGKLLTLKYGKRPRDNEGRLLAYAYADGVLVNQTLVREGLAFVQLAHGEKLLSDDLLAAQAEARRAQRGLWAIVPPSDESAYIGDSRQANFHRPTCRGITDLKPDRQVRFTSKDDAFDRGFAPCRHCKP